ncbi:YbaN family protein [Lutibaculum baratangense]|uniref:DUF454 domain-containing protein n=1 Tax=Lutibaculum baratangense AMV1 TaxID=631454 RepID=V4RN69_9HYPH|nr:YbaN family protein [Lutibaculum baratangense]ESR26734.1 hypothetical protein N177_0518 [Lutibaculum baratangense AMV1]
MRYLLMALGWLAIALGMVALVLPLVPTVPFLILAAMCFAKSSPRVHDWLVEHKRFGPPIRDWRDHGAVGRGLKLSTVGGFAAALAFSAAMGLGAWMLAAQAAFAAAAVSYVLTRPAVPRAAA